MRLDRVAFELEGRPFTVGDALAAAWLGGRLAPLAERVADGLAAASLAAEEETETDEAEIQVALDAWRTERDLIAAEQAEAWLEEQGLTLDDLVAHLDRELLRRRFAPRREEARGRFPPEEAEVQETLPAAAAFEGAIDGLVQELALHAVAEPPAGTDTIVDTPDADRTMFLHAPVIESRSALAQGLAPFGVSPERAERLREVESTFRSRHEELVTDETLRRVLDRNKVNLIQLEVAAAPFATEDAAREAILCVRLDHERLEHVAGRARVPSDRRRVFVEELPGAAL